MCLEPWHPLSDDEGIEQISRDLLISLICALTMCLEGRRLAKLRVLDRAALKNQICLQRAQLWHLTRTRIPNGD